MSGLRNPKTRMTTKSAESMPKKTPFCQGSQLTYASLGLHLPQNLPLKTVPGRQTAHCRGK